jgi:hypothetical protein
MAGGPRIEGAKKEQIVRAGKGSREDGRPGGKSPKPSVGLYWIIAIAMALASVRLFVWLLGQAGLVSDEDGNLVVLLALPFTLFAMARLAPTEDR